MAIAYADTINGQPLTMTIDAVAWAQPLAASWLTQCRELNRLLGKSTHLLRIPATDKSEPIWYAGVAGISLAAGIERMAIAYEVLRDSIVAFPLDSRIYVADVQKGLVREEWCLYLGAFEQRVQAWRAQARNFTLLTGGGRLEIDLPNVAHVPVDIDTAVMTFRHASVALLAAGLVRWRDCVTAFAVVVLAFCMSLALIWWQHAPISEPPQRVASFETTAAEPVRYNASIELASLALLAAEHDVALWQAHKASHLRFQPSVGALELQTGASVVVTTLFTPVNETPAVVPLQPYTIEAFRAKLASHVESLPLKLTFGDPYPIGSSAEWEQHVTVSIGHADESEGVSVASVLVELSEHLVRIPITLNLANCTIEEGVFTGCELLLAIRGRGA